LQNIHYYVLFNKDEQYRFLAGIATMKRQTSQELAAPRREVVNLAHIA
jgi:hypothetical protein